MPVSLITRTMSDIADEAVGVLFNIALAGESPTTYYALGAAVRHPAPGMSAILAEVGKRCIEARIPPLTAFVASHDTNEVVAHGFSQVSSEHPGMARIRGHRWARNLTAVNGQWAHRLYELGLDLRPPITIPPPV